MKTESVFDSREARYSDTARFLEKVSVESDSECWLWQSYKRDNGYGLFWFNGKLVRAHRFSYSLFYQIPLDPEEVLCHRCDEKLCVNPHHMFVGTRADNVRDMREKGRGKLPNEFFGANNRRGVDLSCSKLSEEQVLEIRLRRVKGESLLDLSHAFQVVESVISEICRGRAWSHLPGPTTHRHGNTRFSQEEVENIRARVSAGEQRKVIAAELGVAERTIAKYVGIKNRKTKQLVFTEGKYVGPDTDLSR
jgi:hypothetical protein